MEENGFNVKKVPTTDPDAIRRQHQIPPALYSCHTAIVDGYVIEGHVPAAEVTRLLNERPAVTGLSVPGMPIGSPGMETPGVEPEPYDVLTFDAAGNVGVFASYGR